MPRKACPHSKPAAGKPKGSNTKKKSSNPDAATPLPRQNLSDEQAKTTLSSLVKCVAKIQTEFDTIRDLLGPVIGSTDCENWTEEETRQRLHKLTAFEARCLQLALSCAKASKISEEFFPTMILLKYYDAVKDIPRDQQQEAFAGIFGLELFRIATSEL